MGKADESRRVFELVMAASPREREAALERACGGDHDLRARVEEMIFAAEREELLDRPTADGDLTESDVTVERTVAAPAREGPGTQIGPYKLMQLMGEGGFGSVFMAKQEKPVRRTVALKIIKLGMDTHQVVARFEQERQALALMDHPGIAKVFDAGATDTGRPYFVMELVRGEPISSYCDKNKLSIDERLELFAQVCGAVQHAHTKGIIHRDIKPSNILVSTQEGKAVAKVIDFGIAKATAARLTEMTVFTEHKQLIGTPEYMSPEQAEGSLDIDTRTDVYSLGVLLYELLTGSTPFSSKQLRSAAYGEIQRIIREVEPPKPSTRISQSADSLASVAAMRHVEPRKLGTMVRGELDWIVMRALEKDRMRRYETANGLAMDVRRHLDGEAVLAAPPSAAYRMRKFVRRNKGPVVAVAAIAVVLIGGVAAFAWKVKEATERRDIAVNAQRSEAEQRKAADAQRDAALNAQKAEAEQRKIAESQRDKATKVADFMSETLKGVGPSVAKGRDTTMLREMMDAAAARIEKGELKDVPETEYTLRTTIGHTYFELAAFEPAIKMLEPALEIARSRWADSEAVANSLVILAWVHQALGNMDKAESLYRQAIAIEERIFGGDHRNLASSLISLGSLVQDRRDYPEAEKVIRKGVDMYKRLQLGDQAEVATALNNLGLVLSYRGDLEEAERYFREGVEMHRRLDGPDSLLVANGLNNLGSVMRDRGDLTGAVSLYRESLEMKKRLYPHDFPDKAMTIGNLADALKKGGDLEEAEKLAREALDMFRRLYPGDHANVTTALNNLAVILKERGDLTGAVRLAGEAMEMSKRIFPAGHDHPLVMTSYLAEVSDLMGKHVEAEALWREVLGYRTSKLPESDPRVANIKSRLGACLGAQHKFVEAEPLVVSGFETLAAASGPQPPGRVRGACERLVKFYEAWEAAEPGKGYGAKAAEWKGKLEGLK